MTRHEALPILLELLAPSYKEVDRDDYGIEFVANDETHKARISTSGISFSHPTNLEIQYVFGFKHMKEIRAFLRNTPSFDETEHQKFVEAHQGERKHRSSTLVKLEQKQQKKASRGPSARSMMFEMLAAGKSQDEILAAVQALNTSRDAKSIKQQFYLHRSEFNRAQKAATPTTAS